MKAIQLDQPGHLSMMTAPNPAAPGTDEALIRVHRIGVCGTDIHAFGGRQPFFSYPRILGHELGVEVLEVGNNVTNVRPGDRCSVEPYLNCGSCIACRSGKPNCCCELQVLGVHCDGGMREQFILPARKLHPSGKLSFEQLALVEPLGIGCHAVERGDLTAGEWVLVIGAGPIGLAVIQFAMEANARVIVADINVDRLAFCRERLGVSATINSAKTSTLDVLKDLTSDDLPTAVFDATGNPQSMMSAFEYPAHGGRIIFVGLFQGDVAFHDPNFHRRELTLRASRNAASRDFSRIIELVENGRIDTSPWVTHRASFDEVVTQFPDWTKSATGVIKAVIEV